jgi:hypothetical protein
MVRFCGCIAFGMALGVALLAVAVPLFVEFVDCSKFESF